MVASRELSPSANGPKSALLPSEILAKAADLIAPEGRWTKGHYAKDASGEEVYPPTEQAACLCVYGAIFLATPGVHLVGDAECGPAAGYLRRHLGRALSRYEAHRLDKWNDARKRTQAQVVAALRQASELAKADGQ